MAFQSNEGYASESPSSIEASESRGPLTQGHPQRRLFCRAIVLVYLTLANVVKSPGTADTSCGPD